MRINNEVLPGTRRLQHAALGENLITRRTSDRRELGADVRAAVLVTLVLPDTRALEWQHRAFH
jgi:hypothetical protein